MDKNAVYNRQHYSTYRMNEDKSDVENYVKEILADFLPASSQKVISGVAVSATSPASTSVNISSGWGYSLQDRIVQPSNPLTYTFTDFPASGHFRKDRIYLEYASVLDPTSLTNVEFLQSDGSVITQSIYQRKIDYFTVGVVEGVEDNGTPPTYPTSALKLAQIYLNGTTTAISSGDIIDERVL